MHDTDFYEADRVREIVREAYEIGFMDAFPGDGSDHRQALERLQDDAANLVADAAGRWRAGPQ